MFLVYLRHDFPYIKNSSRIKNSWQNGFIFNEMLLLNIMYLGIIWGNRSFINIESPFLD